MRNASVLAGVCLTLALCATSALAQSGMRTAQRGTTAAVKRARRGHVNTRQLQAAAIAAAQRAERLTRARPLNRTAIREDALATQKDLQGVLQQLERADQKATGTEKQHIAGIRGHEQEALTHADELVAAADKPTPDAATIVLHARGVVQHAQAAQSLMNTATDSWLNTDVTAPQTSGKRQWGTTSDRAGGKRQ